MFTKLPVPDQNHSLRVLDKLQEIGEEDFDLLKTALLHDIGKSQYPLSRWERVASVLLPAIAPRLAERWGKAEPTGIKRAFAVIEQHPKWGAEMLRDAGCGDEVVWLVENHEKTDPLPDGPPGLLEKLKKLQVIDNQN